ncbi:Flagellar biosynthesis protein FliO [Methylophaga frappieri]|uniref:Flagellar protein n=1 Tax=Methylophaga frappieri (strain ATCC BAA-2434 / DSM 25690 / JAM7) TaxID=754477 RepID=I1YHL3_METFJ|nr:Flagellar biosynthesis protein FliO [Methylophaga frappieri]
MLSLSQTAIAAPLTQANPGVDTGNLLQTILGLGLVLLLIWGMAWLLKRSQQWHGSGQQQFRVVAAVALGPREKAVLLQVGENQLLVGVTPQQVNLLQTLSAPLNMDKQGVAINANFADKLRQYLQPGQEK